MCYLGKGTERMEKSTPRQRGKVSFSSWPSKQGVKRSGVGVSEFRAGQCLRMSLVLWNEKRWESSLMFHKLDLGQRCQAPTPWGVDQRADPSYQVGSGSCPQSLPRWWQYLWLLGLGATGMNRSYFVQIRNMVFRTPEELLSKTPEDRLGFWQSAFWAWAGKLPLQTI